MSLTTGEFALLKGAGHEPKDAPVTRQIDGARARPRIEVFDPFDRRPGVAPAQLVEKDPANPAYIQTVWGFG